MWRMKKYSMTRTGGLGTSFFFIFRGFPERGVDPRAVGRSVCELPKETGGKASFEGWAEWAGCRESPPWDLGENLGCVCMTMDDAMRGLRSVTHRARIWV